MASRAGLKRVIKTVRTKKGVKRQTFWVKANPDARVAGRKAQLQRGLANRGPHKESRTARFLGHAARIGSIAAPLIGGLVGEYAGSKHGGAAIHSAGARLLAHTGRGAGMAQSLGGFAQFHHEKIGGMAGGAVGGHLGMAAAAGLAHLARRAGAR